jgi:hypothetical protein
MRVYCCTGALSDTVLAPLQDMILWFLLFLPLQDMILWFLLILPCPAALLRRSNCSRHSFG